MDAKYRRPSRNNLVSNELCARGDANNAVDASLLSLQDGDEPRDISEVDNSVLIDIGFGLENTGLQDGNECCDISKAHTSVHVDISQQ